MDISILMDYVNVIILGICLCVGFMLKNAVKTDKINAYIPVIMGVLGLILNMWMNNWELTPVVLLGGLISGLASTGLYEAFKNLINHKNSEE